METQSEILSIGELARRSGLPVKTIRYYSDVGVLPPADRTSAGYRRYDPTDLARLDLVRTLRALDVDLGTIRRVLERKTSLAEVLTLQAAALDVQARALQVQRAVLRAAVRNGASADFLARAQRAARLSAAERTAVLHRFLDRIMDGIPVDPEWAAWFRRWATPSLPDEPTAEQIDAWLELAELTADEDFIGRQRENAEWFWREVGPRHDPETLRAAMAGANQAALAAATEALREGRSARDPVSQAAVDAWVRLQADLLGRVDGREFRAFLAERYGDGSDTRAERYWQLVAIVNGWPYDPTIGPAYRWLAAALRPARG